MSDVAEHFFTMCAFDVIVYMDNCCGFHCRR